jgi:dihydropyrimidinase
MLDLIIRGGQVVTTWGVGEWDVAVQGEKIVAIAESGTLPAEVGRVIDASGKIVVPGGIEPHAHVASPVPGRPGAKTSPPEPASRAALFGGTTTLTDFAIQHHGLDIPQAIDERTLTWRGNSYCDYSHHCMLMGEIPFNVIAQVKEAIEEGFPTFKIFTTNIRPTDLLTTVDQRRLVGMGHVSGVMEQAANHGGLMFVHAEDDDIVQYMYQKLTREERTEWYNIHEVHNNMSEDLAFRRVLRLSEWTGAAVYFVHVSAKEGLNAIREARGRGLPVYGETLHNYVSFNAEDYKRPDGPQYHTYPSLKSEEDRLALWDGLLKGGINSMATDGSCTEFAMKVQGRTIHDVSGGHHGIETRMGITYSEGVAKRGMSLEQFVDITSTNAARIMGYYPRKGTIAPGSDADIVLIDPGVRKTLSLSDLHLGDYSIWEGWDIQGWPVTTILRGKVMVEDGQFFGSPTDGQFIPRKIASEILSRPAC